MQKPKQTLKILLISLILGLPQLALANSLIVSTVKNPDPYSGNQSWFRYYQSPGSVIEDAIVLRNAGNQPETIKLYATDATSNEAGSFSPKMAEDRQTGLGLWTTLEQQEVTLQPNESSEVKFSITIPEDISPGQYFGSVINEKVNNEPCDEIQTVSGYCQGNIQIRTRTGNRIYLTIPGEVIQDIKLNSFTWKKTDANTARFYFSFTNNGNIAFEPKTIIRIYDNWNRQIKVIEGKLGKSLPGTTINPMIDWDLKGNFGNFTAKAEIYYHEDDQGRFDNLRGTVLSERSELKILVFPWTVFFSLGSILLLIIIGWYGRHLYYEKLLSKCTEYTVKPDENLLEIASRHSVKWQTIACINKLKAPYSLVAKQKLKIPTSHNSKYEK